MKISQPGERKGYSDPWGPKDRNRMYPDMTTRDIIIKFSKFKDKKFKAAQEKSDIACKEIPIRLSADFLRGIFQARE